MEELLDVPGLRRTSASFRAQLVAQSRAANLDPQKVAAVISLESEFKPSKPNGSHDGLLQFAREYFAELAQAAGLPNLKWEDLPRTSAEEQLPLVTTYFRQHGIKASSRAGDYLTAVFLPSQLGQPMSTVVAKQGSSDMLPGTKMFLGTLYAQNTSYDTNRDGEITISDLHDKIDGLIAAAQSRPPLSALALSSSQGWLGFLLVAGGLAFIALRR